MNYGNKLLMTLELKRKPPKYIQTTLIHQQQFGPLSVMFRDILLMDFLIASSRWVLKPLPEKGTQKNRQLKRKAKGQQAGIRPVEKDLASATVSMIEENRVFIMMYYHYYYYYYYYYYDMTHSFLSSVIHAKRLKVFIV